MFENSTIPWYKRTALKNWTDQLASVLNAILIFLVHTQTHTGISLLIFCSFKNDLQVFIYFVQLVEVPTTTLCTPHTHTRARTLSSYPDERELMNVRLFITESSLVLCIPLWLISIRMRGSVSALLGITWCLTTALLHPRLCSCIIEGVWQQYTEQCCAAVRGDLIYADGSCCCGCSNVLLEIYLDLNVVSRNRLRWGHTR